MRYLFFFLYFIATFASASQVEVGIERLLSPQYSERLNGKRVGVITNQTGVDRKLQSTLAQLFDHQKAFKYKLSAIFSPEHGLDGSGHAWEKISHGQHKTAIPVYSLYGSTRRPTDEMLKDLDLLIFDIQDIGSRSYTYISTLFYVMEEAALRRIPVMVTDRPNPINGITVDGPMLEERWRSIVGYINVPYCHGMTVGELAQFFNEEYDVGCQLSVIPMNGWNRNMTFADTGLPWIPTSPHIPEPDSPLYYPTTGILGELQLVNIGVGYTLPFKLIGTPWISADEFAAKLNSQNFPGVHFQPFHYKPFYGSYKGKSCHGVLIVVTDPLTYRPVSTQYLLMGMLKTLYPKEFADAIKRTKKRKEMFCKVNGTEEVYRILTEEQYVTWQLKAVHRQERENFQRLRKKYLISSYGAG